MESSNSPNKAIIGIIIVVLLVVAATAVIVMGSDNNQSESSTVSDASTSPSVSASPAAADESAGSSSTSSLKDGMYSATGNYQTPGGRESIGVTVTLSSGTITDASVQQKASGGESVEFQGKFASGFKSLVVGKNIDEVSLSRVAGSSLTSGGFNNALQDIENQAKA